MQTAIDMMVEIGKLNEDDFLKIKETLTRIGISSETETEKKLYPSVVLLHKKGKYYLSHFKVMFMLDGKTANISNLDIKRFKTIVHLIKTWGLCKIVDKEKEIDCAQTFNPRLVKIVPFTEKNSWKIIQKYSIGTRN